jgi:hypothetical protein
LLGRSQALGVLFEALDAEEFRADWLFEWLWCKLRRRVGALFHEEKSSIQERARWRSHVSH